MAQKRKRRTAHKRRKTSLTLRERIVFSFTALALLAGFVVSVSQTGQLPFDWDDIYGWFGLAGDPMPIETIDPNTDAIHFIDVGQGDAALIQSQGEYCLIDTGLPDAKDQLFEYLNELGVQKIKLLVMSHPHADHIGSMDQVLRSFSVEQILLPDFSKAPYPTSATFERVMDAIEEKEIPAVTAKSGQEFSIGSGVLTVLADGIKTDNLNDLSQVLYYEAGNLTAVFSGDAERAAEKAALEEEVVRSAKIFKAGHHGSNTSNTKAFLDKVSPRYVVICCGEDNRYGHPHKESMARFEKLGAQILRTDLDGSVVIAQQDGMLQSYTSRQMKEAA